MPKSPTNRSAGRLIKDRGSSSRRGFWSRRRTSNVEGKFAGARADDSGDEEARAGNVFYVANRNQNPVRNEVLRAEETELRTLETGNRCDGPRD